jgi:hypothetical protein
LQTGHTIKGNLEKSILKKGMRLILQFGRRIADLLIKVGNGYGLNVAKQVLKSIKII